MTSVSFSPNLRPYLSIEDGELVCEPLPGIAFAPSTSRLDLVEHLTDLASYGICEIMLQQEDGMTYFTITANEESMLLVFEDESDRLVAVIPVNDIGDRTWN